MEMQFYPPGFVKWPLGISCDAHRWCMAINIWSLSIDYNTGTFNNVDCLNTAGVEPGNFSWITKMAWPLFRPTRSALAGTIRHRRATYCSWAAGTKSRSSSATRAPGSASRSGT
jgi:hypothetical protein